jgi:hypothetical protein
VISTTISGFTQCTRDSSGGEPNRLLRGGGAWTGMLRTSGGFNWLGRFKPRLRIAAPSRTCRMTWLCRKFDFGYDAPIFQEPPKFVLGHAGADTTCVDELALGREGVDVGLAYEELSPTAMHQMYPRPPSGSVHPITTNSSRLRHLDFTHNP